MPKHVFEKAADPQKFDFNPPVSIGAYKITALILTGSGTSGRSRDDWQRTSLGRYGEPGPKFAAYIDPGPPDKRVIAQLNHNLDVVHDIAPEGMFTLTKQSPSLRPGSRTSHSRIPIRPCLVIFNYRKPAFQNRDVRWALALLIDIKAVSMASYRGAATLSPIGIRRRELILTITTSRFRSGFVLRDRHRQEQDQAVRSEHRRPDRRYAASHDERADPNGSSGDQEGFGYGWWKPNPQAATSSWRRPATRNAAMLGTRPTASRSRSS